MISVNYLELDKQSYVKDAAEFYALLDKRGYSAEFIDDNIISIAKIIYRKRCKDGVKCVIALVKEKNVDKFIEVAKLNIYYPVMKENINGKVELKVFKDKKLAEIYTNSLQADKSFIGIHTYEVFGLRTTRTIKEIENIIKQVMTRYGIESVTQEILNKCIISENI